MTQTAGTLMIVPDLPRGETHEWKALKICMMAGIRSGAVERGFCEREWIVGFRFSISNGTGWDGLGRLPHG